MRTVTNVHKIEFIPPLPGNSSECCNNQEKRIQALEQVKMGRVVKFVVEYSTSFWREKGLSGESMSDAAVGFTFDYCNRFLVCYALGKDALTLSQLEPSKVEHQHC